MGPYLPLLRIDVGHGYFADDQARGLRFVPVGATAWWLRASDAIVRESGSTLAVYGPAGCQRVDPHTVLQWHLYADDDDFAHYTDHPAQRPHELLYIDTTDAHADEDGGGWRLPIDWRPRSWPLVAASLHSGQRWLPPLGLLRVPLATLPAPPVAYRLRFAARATVWKYCLHGDWPEPALQVVDLARQAEFDAPEPDRLDSGRPLLAIRSRAPIALAQRSAQRFQLCSRQRSGDKVLVPRLPVAAAQFLAREQIGGASRLVSEIHVHR